MIEVYSWATPNGHKVHIMLEECGLPYRAIPVNIGAGDQFKPEFLAISPNNKIPAIVDPDGPGRQADLAVRIGRDPALPRRQDRPLPARSDLRGKYEVLQWLMFQMGSVGPMLGQAHHFRLYAPEKIPYAIDRYSNEAKRLYGVIDKRLGQSRYIAGRRVHDRRHRDLPVAALAGRTRASSWTTIPHLKGWFDEHRRAPGGAARRRGAGRAAQAHPDDKEREVLFGATQYQRR